MALNVLVVDDSSVMRKMVLKTLKLAGLDIGETHEASNGREGLDVLEDNWIDMAFVDINMPVMNGEEMIQRVRANDAWKEMPIVVISTEGSKTRIERIRHNDVRFVHKPFAPETVREIIQAMTGVECGGDEAEMQQSSQADTGGKDNGGVLQAVAEQTFESLAFIFTMPEEMLDAPPENTDKLMVSVSFDGPVNGTLFLSVPTEMLIELGSNMLGLDDAPNSDDQRDALKELINVVCGNLLPAIAGDDAVFDVHAPSPPNTESIPLELSARPPAATASLMLDYGEAQLSLFLDGSLVETGAAG